MAEVRVAAGPKLVYPNSHRKAAREIGRCICRVHGLYGYACQAKQHGGVRIRGGLEEVNVETGRKYMGREER